MGSLLGVMKVAAKRLGVSLDDYQARIAAGEKWCTTCKAWCARKDFDSDSSRTDGLSATCKPCRQRMFAASYIPKGPAPSRLGIHLAEARDGDKKQARARVNHRVDVGLIPDPNNLPCSDCGHIYVHGERRHEYDHARGYSRAHQLYVEAVCTTCHHAREARR